MKIHYWMDQENIAGMSITPLQLDEKIAVRRKNLNGERGIKPIYELYKTDFPAFTQSNLVQLKVSGDASAGCLSGGATMTNSSSTKNLRFVRQHVESSIGQFTIVTQLADQRKLKAFHKVVCREGHPFLEVFTEVENDSDTALTLEMLTSFSVGGLSPFQGDDGIGKYKIHRFLSNWSAEGRHESRSVEELNLERSWAGCGVRCLRFGQVGSMPVKGWFPFVAFEDCENNVLWGAQVVHPASWQLEIFRQCDLLNMCGGLADREFGHWTKVLQPGEFFRSPSAILSCCCGDIQDLTARLIQYQHLNDALLPKIEQDLPIVFNDWCTTWGQPTEQNICRLADLLQGKGITYLVMDDGWHSDRPGIQQALGDWNVSSSNYPNGFKELCRKLHHKGFIPGIWFEFESCTEGSALYEMTEHLLHRDGYVLQAGNRRFLDFRDPWVHEYLSDKVIRMLKENHIGYIKTDYNDTIGLGCDGKESLGEELRCHLEGVQRFYQRLQKEIPELVIEICSSGGHRLEPSWMALGCMGSCSDSHEGTDVPIIAAHTQMMVSARKNLVWSVLRKTDSFSRIYYSMSAAFLGRMCLSGDIHALSDKQMSVVDAGIHMYKAVRETIKAGSTRRYGLPLLSYTH
ncbi:MAG: glycoside hydrolase family 36 protein, partial [Kiritimatiellales bacterium]